MSFTLSLILVFAFVAIGYGIIFGALVYAHGRLYDLVSLFDNIPRTRTVLLCMIYPFIMFQALIHGVCAFLYQGAKHGYQHLHAIVAGTYSTWNRAIGYSISLHDPTARAILRQARRAGFNEDR